MTEIIAEGAFGPDPVTVPLRINFQGEPIGEATVYPDGTMTATITNPDTVEALTDGTTP